MTGATPIELDLLIKIGVFVGMLYGLYRFIWLKAWPKLKSVASATVEIGQALVMMPQAVQSLQRIQTMDTILGKIHAQVMPNGGSTLRDEITRQGTALRELSADVAILTGTIRANGDSDPHRALFECDSYGENIWVNTTYCRWVNRSERELLGWGFLNSVPEIDRERVRLEWFAAMGEERQYYCRHYLTGQDGEFLVDTTATPIPEGKKPQRWIGVIRKVEAI